MASPPAWIDTPMWDHVDAQFAKYQNLPLGEKKRQVGLAVPYGRMGRPEDRVGAAVFLASGRCRLYRRPDAERLWRQLDELKVCAIGPGRALQTAQRSGA